MKHHPSVFVLSGNNENEKALVQDWYGTDINFTRYKEDYIKVRHSAIISIVNNGNISFELLADIPILPRRITKQQ